MFCQECGTQLPDDSMFCPECGAKQTMESSIQEIPNDNYEKEGNSETQSTNGQEETAKRKKRNIIIGSVVGTSLLIAIVISVLSIFIKPKIDLNNYINVSFEGYDTVGRAVVELDREKLCQNYGKKISKKLGISENAAIESFLKDCVYVSLDKSEGLSNGEQIKLKWECNDQNVLKNYGYVLKYEDVEYTVSGLKEAEMFDLFEGVEVKFEGISPNGEAYIDEDSISIEADYVNFEIDQDSGLSNGDIVTVTATMYGEDVEQYCLTNYGKIPSALSKQYTVDGLNSYVSKIAEVSEKSLKEMQSQAQDVYNAEVAENWDEEDGETLNSLDYQGCYLLTHKSDDSWEDHNIFYLVYKVQIHNTFKSGKKKYDKTNSIYWYISYKNLLVNNKGETSVDVLDYIETSNSVEIDSGLDDGWSTKTWYYDGYESLDKLYEDVVTSNAAEYNHEENINGENSKLNGKKSSSENLSDVEEGIIFPNSSTEPLDESDVKSLTDEEVQKAINEIYARNGYIFKDETKQKYYEKYDWYEGKIASDDFSKDVFNNTERENVELLEKERSKR